MNEKDEALLTLLDLTVARDEIASGVQQTLQRMVLYFENFGLMQKIDTADVLLEDMRDLLKMSYGQAMSQIGAEPYSKPFKDNYEKLSEAGKDTYWAGTINIDLIRKSDLPWFDIIAARQRELAARR